MEIYIQQQMLFFVRIAVSCVCGAVIGVERQQRIKVAGTRTHMMIALASTLMMIVSKYGFMDVVVLEGVSVDASRVAASIITGVGILAGGIIITGKQGYVSGITTAAGIGVTIGIGMAVGSGMYMLGIGTTIFVVVVQMFLHKNLWIVKQPVRAQVAFHIGRGQDGYERVIKELEQYGIHMNQFKWQRKSKEAMQFRCQVIIPAKYTREEIIKIFTEMPELDTFEVL
ncbi:Mg2+ transporter-C, MgtC family protein [bacterium C-53]|nr:Mg2+ transporter-C, MgtC family protein [Lachnospiraceae bacterium]NBI01423.1 Mg2+ transporter-C, MgtC family protein [Lachnospiraceae bacterium]RKJ12736.1 Mg2+ transporter-C, MgtC family protein [bacterium C-53]